MAFLNFLEPLFLNSVFQFFVYLALLQILAQVFLERRIAFWIASISTTYLWTVNFEPITPLKGWTIILSVLFVYFLIKHLFHINLFLLLKGKKGVACVTLRFIERLLYVHSAIIDFPRKKKMLRFSLRKASDP